MNKDNARTRSRALMIAAVVGCALVTGMPVIATAQEAISLDIEELKPGDNAVLLPPATVTPSDPFTDPSYYGRVLKHLPCIGACEAPAPAQPSKLVRALLWMLYPTEPPELTEADRLRIQVKRDNQRADKLP